MVEGHSRDYLQIAKDYATAAVKDKRHKAVCKWTRLACKRFLDDLKRAVKPGCGFTFDEWSGADPCDFIEKLPHVEGEWESPEIVLEPWQIFILVCLFGFRCGKHRRFNTCYLEVARKNAKSTLSSGIALYCLTCEGEVGPQVKTAATTGSQARIVFDVARKMVEKTPALASAFSLDPMANSIVCLDNNGSIQPINAKASTQDGLNPHLSILDELHAHDKRDLFDVLKSARGARKNPLSFYITTAGYNVLGVCYEQRTLLTKILQGLIDADHYFGIIFTLDEGDDELNPETWQKANPNLNVSVQLKELEGYAEEAKYSPDSMGEFKTKRCNVWTSAKNAWINLDMWRKCDGVVDLQALADVPCYPGMDLASTSDIAAVTLVWRVDGRLKMWGRYYLPEDVVRPRTERGNVPYKTWCDQGYLITTPGNRIDYSYIEKDLDDLKSRFNIQFIGYDKWNAYDLVNRLMEKEYPMVEVVQGPITYNAPMKELECHIRAGTLDHGGNPVLAWMASNLIARQDVNKNLAPDKKNSQEKIDGIVAGLMGLSLLMTQEQDINPYDQRGLRVIEA